MEDVRAGRLLRALRLRTRLTQSALGARVGLSQQQISLIERGHLDIMPARSVRAAVRGVGAIVSWEIRWRGGAIDRLLDERHSTIVGALSTMLVGLGWEVIPELTYSEFGERGSIDLVAWHAETGTLLVIEVKTELTSVEQTCRKHDEKVRLAPKLVRERFGWRPGSVERLLVLPEHRTARRQVERANAVLTSLYPIRGWDIRRWTSTPAGRGDGVMFLAADARSPRSRA